MPNKNSKKPPLSQKLALVLCLACLATLLALRPQDEVATVLLAALAVAAILARKR